MRRLFSADLAGKNAAAREEEAMGRRPSNKPTSFDIAYLAGVSQPTVSRGLSGFPCVGGRLNITPPWP
jgi:hypothetical protein